MFEDFRKPMDGSAPEEVEQEEQLIFEKNEQKHYFLGLKPVQRFFLAVMLLMMTVVLGTLFLLVTSKIIPPFFG